MELFQYSKLIKYIPLNVMIGFIKVMMLMGGCDGKDNSSDEDM